MTAQRSVESIVEAWLADDFAAEPDNATMLRDIAAVTATTPQRQHRWWPFGRRTTIARPGLSGNDAMLVPTRVTDAERSTRALFLAHPVRLVVAGVVLALSGGLLVYALPAEQPARPVVPGVQSASPAPSPSIDPEADPGVGSAIVPGRPGIRLASLDGACESAGDCSWGEPGAWEVMSIHHGDFPGADAMTVGPSGSPWIWSADACGDRLAGEEFPCVWQIGVPGYSIFPPLADQNDPGDQTWRLDEAQDGILWAAGTLGLYSFDGQTWTRHWSGTTLTDLTIAPDGTVLAIGGGPAGRGGWDSPDDITVVRVDDAGVSAQPVDVISKERWPVAIASTSDGDIWISAIASGYVAPAFGESLLARFDGETWEAVWPLGRDYDTAAWDLASSPDDGSLWAILSTFSDSEGPGSYLANLHDQEWLWFERGGLDTDDFGDDRGRDAPLDFGFSLEVSPLGNPWYTTMDRAAGEPWGIGRFAAWIWFQYLDDRSIGLLDVGPDGTVWVTTSPGFDEQSLLLALRP